MAICAEADLQLAIMEDIVGPRATQQLKLSLAALVAFLSVTVALLTHTTHIERSWDHMKLPPGTLHVPHVAEIQMRQECRYSVSIASHRRPPSCHAMLKLSCQARQMIVSPFSCLLSL